MDDRTPDEEGLTPELDGLTPEIDWLAPEGEEESPVYGLYRRGIELLEDASFEAAIVPLEEAARLEPEKTSIREALGRAYFRSNRFNQAAAEFEAIVETHPVDDYAHFCLGRSLTMIGRFDQARHHLAMASNLKPERDDYRTYRERLESSES